MSTEASTRGCSVRRLPTAPNLLSQDRVEVVSFAKRGTYLVICAVNVHFAEGMYGWVRVIK